ncbi:MAG: hypothetical protein NZL91_08090 [Thermoflexales bacterium]|nr:hypothetical protein [Thermoflexales bacterium]MDW8292670.1 hypothetical protein [Anaerolineae bacterium]
MSRLRLWLERVGVGVIAFLSLSAPFVFGFVYYLGVTDGLEINAGDPLRESRVWMIHERSGPAGIGWLYTRPVEAPQEGVQCALSQLILFEWRAGLSLRTDAEYCRCFTPDANGRLRESAVTCR